jgi:hypothetical protein
MNMWVLLGALIAFASMSIGVPSNPSRAQPNEPSRSASKSTTTKVSPTKHRYWRHRGGRHPHYGSRRIRM